MDEVDEDHLVGYDRAGGCSGVCCDNDSSIVETANDGGTGGSSFRKRYALRVKREVPVVVAEVEARHVVL